MDESNAGKIGYTQLADDTILGAVGGANIYPGSGGYGTPLTPSIFPNTYFAVNPRIAELEAQVLELRADLARERALSDQHIDIITKLINNFLTE